MRNAPRTMPAALALGVTCVTVIYLAMTIAFIYLVPVQQTTSASEFARRAGEAMLGQAGPSALASIVVLSILASALALLIMAPRLYVAMSDDGLFLRLSHQSTPGPGLPAHRLLGQRHKTEARS